MAIPVAVELWGRRIGAVAWPAGERAASFEYDPAFVRSGIQVSPLVMPLSGQVYRFQELAPAAFRGLPGLLADALPDRFGNALIDAWLARQGRSSASFTALDRLCYVGKRAMGALSFTPALGPAPGAGEPVEVSRLVELASEVLRAREGLHASLAGEGPHEGLIEILRVGTSAGGARAKALVAWNPATGEVRSGQVAAAAGFSQWLLKFDGVAQNRDKELADPWGYGTIEFAYHRMAIAAGIRMAECRLLEEGGRRHFITRRFDRPEGGGRLHMQSLAALAHLDFNAAGAHGYEQALLTIRRLGLGVEVAEEQFRRMVFNIVARNQDDHVKNIAFLMDKAGRWSLSPAFDLTWAFNPSGAWTNTHQMTVNGKRDGFTLADLEAVAAVASLRRGRARAIVAEVVAAVRGWPREAEAAGIEPGRAAYIAGTHRVDLDR